MSDREELEELRRLEELERKAAGDPLIAGARDRADPYGVAAQNMSRAEQRRRQAGPFEASVPGVMLRGAAEGPVSLARGVGQLGTRLVAGPAAFAEQLSGQPGPATGLIQGFDEIVRNQEADYAASPAGQSILGTLAKLGTETAVTWPLAAASIPAKGATLLQRGAAGAAGGGALAAMQPATGENFAAGKGAQTGTGTVAGGILGPLGYGTVRAYEGLKPMVLRRLGRGPQLAEQEAGELSRELAANPEAALNNLRTAPRVLVEGSNPTTAELSDDVGWLAAQNYLRTGDDPTLRNFINERDRAANQAYEGLVRREFQGADEASRVRLQKARDEQGELDRRGMVRGENAYPDDESLGTYTGINTQPVIDRVGRLFEEASGQPDVQKVLKPIARQLFRREITETERRQNAETVLSTLLKNQQEPLSRVPYEAKALRALSQGVDLTDRQFNTLARSGNPAVKALFDAYNNVVSYGVKNVDDFNRLYGARKQLSQWIDNKATDTAGGQKRQSASQLIKIRDALDEEINRVAPFDDYLANFRAGSRLMDQNLVGQEILRTRDPLTREFGGATARVLRDPDEVVRDVTQIPGNRADEVLTPEQRKAMENILADQQRRARPAGIGSATTNDPARGIGGVLSLSLPGLVVNRIVNTLSKKHGEETGRVLREMYANPDRMVEILAKLPPATRRDTIRQAWGAAGLQGADKVIAAVQEYARADYQRRNQYADLPSYTP